MWILQDLLEGPAPAGSRGTLRMTASVTRKVKKKGRERGLIFLGLHRKPIKLLPVFQRVILKEEQREKREKRKKKNDTGRPSFSERGT